MSSPDLPGGLRGDIVRTLKVGVIVGCFLLLVGAGLVYAHGVSSIHASAGEVSVDSLPAGFARGDGQAYLLLGVLVLVLTPLVRVLLSLGIFALAEDLAFSLIVLYVLVVLSLGLVLGVVG